MPATQSSPYFSACDRWPLESNGGDAAATEAAESTASTLWFSGRCSAHALAAVLEPTSTVAHMQQIDMLKPRSAARGEPLGWYCRPNGSLFASPTPGLPSGRLWGAAKGELLPPALLIHALAPARLLLTLPSLMLADTCICTAARRDGARSLPLMPAVTAVAILVVGCLATLCVCGYGGSRGVLWCARARVSGACLVPGGAILATRPG